MYVVFSVNRLAISETFRSAMLSFFLMFCVGALFFFIVSQHRVQFSVNLDVTSYKNGVRETHNPKGRALAPVVWDFYEVC